MKVVNEKGRLFGKLNIIDLLAILVILIVIIFAGVKFLGGSKEAPAPTGRLTYTVRVTAQRPEVADWVKNYVDITTGKSDQLMASGAMLDAYIVDFKTEPTKYNVLTDGSIKFYDESEMEAIGLVDLCFVVQANTADMVTSTVGPQEVRVGRSHILKTTHLEFSYGTVESCTWDYGA